MHAQCFRLGWRECARAVQVRRQWRRCSALKGDLRWHSMLRKSKSADGGGSAVPVGAPAPSPAAATAMAPMRDPSRLCVPRGGARHRSRWCTVVMPPSSPEPPRPAIAAPYPRLRVRYLHRLSRTGFVCSAGFFEPTGRRGCVCSSGIRARMPAWLRVRRRVPRPPFARRVVRHRDLERVS